MKKHVLAGLLLATATMLAPVAHAQGKTFYWISHGSPADPVWTYYLDGAEQWAAATGNQINTSFHNGDVPSQQEAVRAAIADGAAGIAVASPQEGSLVELVEESIAQNIPIVAFNSNGGKQVVPPIVIDLNSHSGSEPNPMNLIFGF